MKHTGMMENSKQAKAMLMLGSFLKKFSFGANVQLRGFEIVGGGMGNFTEEIFQLGYGNLTSDFDHFKFFQSLKQHSVHIDHELKSKLG